MWARFSSALANAMTDNKLQDQQRCSIFDIVSPRG